MTEEAGSVPPLSARTAQRCEDAIGLEALCGQVAEQPLELAIVGNHRSTVQPALQRCDEERIGIEVGKHLVDRLLRQRAADTGGLDLPSDAQPAATAKPGLSMSDGHRDPPIIERALLPEPGHSGVDIVGLMPAPGEALTDLDFGQFAAGEQLQAGEIGASAQTS